MTEAERRLDRNTTCAASSHPLKAPIVVCDLGYLYNKEDLIEKMLSKTLPAELSHLRSLKDVCDATLHANPAWKPDGEGHRSGAHNVNVLRPWICVKKLALLSKWLCETVPAGPAQKPVDSTPSLAYPCVAALSARPCSQPRG